MKKIILVGYMGAGKSLIARLLSEKLGLKSLDLDEIIEKKSQLSIQTIFETKGEIYFRKLEHELLLELIASDEEMVLSVGGGTPCYSNNHELLNGNNVVSVYLKGSIETLYNRLSVNKDGRPLIASIEGDELKEFIAKHLFDRSFYYNQATFKVSVDEKSPEVIVAAIENLLA